MDNDLTTEDLDRLDALAAAATPGPWKVVGESVYTDDEQYYVARRADAEDVQFIAAANPHTVSALTKAIRERDAEIARLRILLRSTVDAYESDTIAPGENEAERRVDLKRMINGE